MKLIPTLLLALLIGLQASAASSPTVLSLPLGPEGVHFEGVGIPDGSPWGPTALAVDGSGRMLVADAVARRILIFGPGGERLAILAIDDAVAAITDVEVAAGAIWVLDAASEPAQIWKLAGCGERLGRIELPSSLGLDRGISGLARGPRGELLAEVLGGSRLVQLTDGAGQPLEQVAPAQALTRSGAVVQVVAADWAGPEPGRGLVTVGSRAFPVESPNLLGGISVLDATPDGTATLLVEEVALDETIQVDVTVRRIDAWGRTTMARVPSSFLHVRHGVALGPDGAAYALVTREDGADVLRLPLLEALPAILPARHEAPPLSMQSSDVVCISRTTMENNAWAIRNSYTTLSSTNTDGYCAGRGKPRYIGGAGSYRSIAYDWGGFDSLSLYRSYMTNGYKAGDINTSSVESCSRGLDCSGFVSRAWGTSSKYGTSTLPSISTQLSSTTLLKTGDILNKAGSHVVLFDYVSSQGVWAWEATTGGYDRVIWNINPWSRYAGYVPRRYVNVCP